MRGKGRKKQSGGGKRGEKNMGDFRQINSIVK